MEESDIELMLRLKAGDVAAFETLVKRYRKPLINMIYRFLGEPMEAEDLAQEVFLKVWGMKDKYKPKGKVASLFYAIAKNLCMNRLREKKKAKISSFEDLRGMESKIVSLSSQETRADKIVEQKDLQQFIKTIIQSLPENQKLAIILREYQDLSYAEIAKIMNCSVKSVEAYLYRARETIKTKLEGYMR